MIHSQNLKIRITLSVFTALLVGMLLTDIVVCAVWYNRQVGKEKAAAVRLLQLSSGIEAQKLGRGISVHPSSVVELINSVLDTACLQILVQVNDEGGGRAEYFSSRQHPAKIKFIHELEAAVADATTSEKLVVREVNVSAVEDLWGTRYLILAYPILGNLDNSVNSANTVSLGGIGVLLSTNQIVATIWGVQKIVAVYILLNAIILATITLFRMKKVVLDPVDKLVLQADNYQLTDGGGMFFENTEGELEHLHRAMGSMVKKIELDRERLRKTVVELAESNARLSEAQEEIVQAEKLAAIGRLSSGLAHEIGNPVAIVQGYLELIAREDVSVDERRQFMKRGLSELQRIDTLIKQLLEMARTTDNNQEPVALNEAVAKVLDLLQLPLSKNGIDVIVEDAGKDCTLWADSNKLQQLLMNIILNSIDALAEKEEEIPKIEVEISRKAQQNEHNDLICLVIRDNGIGIDKENLDLVLEPFFTTKEPGKGTGLGMAVANRIVRSMNGALSFSGEKGRGAEVTVTFPAHVQAVQGELAELTSYGS